MPRRVLPLALFPILVTLPGCNDTGTTVVTPAGIVIVSGDAQTGTVGQPLPSTITIRVVDDDGNAIAGVEVTFTPGAGSVAPGTGTTNGSGEASTTWTLGTTAGAQSLTAAADAIEEDIAATAEPGPLASLDAGPDPDTFTALGETAQLSATGADEFGNAVTPTTTWSSTDAAVAHVSASGLVTAQQNGTANIVASAGAAEDTVAVAVAQEVAGVSITSPTDRVAWSRTLQLTGGAVDANGFPVAGGGAPSWSSADPTLASVDANGLVTGEGLGTVDITVMQDGESASLAVTVTPIPEASLSKREAGGCALDESGAAHCWGYGANGQNGDGTFSSSSVPVAVSGGHQFVALGTAMRRHHCALTEDGTAYCWGANGDNQLGDGTGTNSSIPVAVQGGLAFRSIGAGYSHTCGLTTADTVYCWGNNGAGQLGDGTTTNRDAPVAVMTDSTFDTLSVGGHTTCVLDGTDAYCWGQNSQGEAGDGTNTSPRTEPVPVAGGHAFSQLSTGGVHACALEVGGTAYCWGRNNYGQLGDGSETASNMPVAVDGPGPVDAIAAGYWTTCAIDGGTGYCWGDNNRGVLGDGTLTRRHTPVTVAGGLSWSVLIPGQIVTCGVTTMGAPYCWGDTEWLGDGSTLRATEPVAVAGGHTFDAITTGNEHTCGTTTASDVFCWGTNAVGQLGLGDTEFRTTPTEVTSGSPAWADAGWIFTCGLSGTGAGLCWGDGQLAQLGVGNRNSYDLPQAVDAAFSFASITTGRFHACGIRESDDAAYCWGTNGQGQLGNDTTQDRLSPDAVAGGLTFSTLAAGDFHTCGLTSAGDAYCWGDNFYGQLGDAGNMDSDVPVAVSGGLTFAGIDAGGIHTCAWTAAGEAYCWGANDYGQVGDVTNTDRNAPVPVSGGLSFDQVSTGAYNTCAVTTAGDPYCWGWNADGQGGDGTFTDRDVPTAVSAGFTAASIAAGYQHACAVGTDGAGYCWGHRRFGQLGDGSSEYTRLPSPVAGAFVVPTGP